MRIGKTRVLRTALYATVLATLVTAIILPRVAADNPLFRVRVLMAVPDNAGVDVWIDDVQLAANAQFKTVTAYAQRQDGDYELSVYPAGRKTQSAAYVYKRVVKFRSPKDYTVVVMGRQSDASIDASVEIDRNTLDGSTNAKVRFGNYIPGTSTLTLAVAVSNTILGNAKARETAEYVAITTGTYSLILNDGNGNLITRMDNVTLGPNTTVSVFAVGLSGGTPAPSLVVTTDAAVDRSRRPCGTWGTAPRPDAHLRSECITSAGVPARPIRREHEHKGLLHRDGPHAWRRLQDLLGGAWRVGAVRLPDHRGVSGSLADRREDLHDAVFRACALRVSPGEQGDAVRSFAGPSRS